MEEYMDEVKVTISGESIKGIHNTGRCVHKKHSMMKTIVCRICI